MQNILLIVFLIFIFGCERNVNNRIDQKNEIYTAQKSFVEIPNRISRKILDSLICALPYWRLDKFKTTDYGESLAVDFLRKELALKGFKTNEFIIYNIKTSENFCFTFYLDHIDGYVYRFNLDKANSELSKNPLSDGSIDEIMPSTGNISGYEGWYTVDMERKKLVISYAQ